MLLLLSAEMQYCEANMQKHSAVPPIAYLS